MRIAVATLLTLVTVCRADGGGVPEIAPPEDRWGERVAQAALDGKLADCVAPLAEQLKLDLARPDDAAIVRGAALYRTAAFFGRVTEWDDNARAAVAWLARTPALDATVALATTDDDQPDRVLAVLAELYRARKNELAAWPDLTAALCVVWDAQPKASEEDAKPNGEWARRLFDYFRNVNGRLRYSMQDLPWPLQTYVVDLSVGENEVLWAWRRYSNRGDIGSVYFDVAYDTNAFYNGGDKKIAGFDYTLENLQKYGGICVDQAYYATQIGRLLGVPVATIEGQGGGGEVAHAWVGFLDRQGRAVSWNLKSGRYEYQLYWTGQVVDPQSRQNISESEVALLSELQKAQPIDRTVALALLRAADVVEPAKQADLLVASINRCCGYRQAWLKLADLCAAGKLTAPQQAEVSEVVRKFAAKKYADLAFEIDTRMFAGMSNLDAIARLDALVTDFKDRPDLIATIRLKQGDLYRGLKRTDLALQSYGQVLTAGLLTGPVLVEAMQQTDTLLRGTHDNARLAAIYAKVFASVPQPQPSSYAQYAPFCVIGRAYAELCDDLGDRQMAQRVRQRVATFDTSVLNR